MKNEHAELDMSARALFERSLANSFDFRFSASQQLRLGRAGPTHELSSLGLLHVLLSNIAPE